MWEMNQFNPKIPMIIKVRNDKPFFERRKKEVTSRGHKILAEGKHIENGITIYWAKIDREER